MSHDGANGSDLDILRHSTAHVMAKAVQRFYPGSKLAIGPTIENGFYYDIDIPQTISTDDLGAIEAEMRTMLQRIYGTSWPSQEQLDHYLWQIEEARRRDHRRLGLDLALFFFDDLAPGQPFWLPHGITVMQQLEELLRAELRQRGY